MNTEKKPADLNHALLSDLVANTRLTLRKLSADVEARTGISVSPSTLSRLGQQERGNGFDVDTICAVAAYFEVPVASLFTGGVEAGETAGTGQGDVVLALSSADDLTDDDKAALLHLYRKVRKGK